jgi:16S rRNA (guanine527-N7)-methyltransferase
VTPAGQLAAGAAQLGLDLSPQTQQALLDFLALLEKWNRVYNLTAVRDRAEMVSQHLLDCLAIVPHVRARTILDVGSGGGFPGIPLALALPDAQLTLLDSRQKKATFLRQALIELAIGNATVARARVEDWHAGCVFELVVSRAFSDLAEFAARCGHLVAPGGALGAMKGAYPRDELARLPRGFRLRAAHTLSVPGLDAERHLVLISRD